MREKYTITIKTNSVPSEVAATHFMTQVFKLAEESNLIGAELNIVRTELPDETIEEAMERVNKSRNLSKE